MVIIQNVFRKLYDLPCWNVRDSLFTVTMHFGQPSLNIREPKEISTITDEVSYLFSLRTVKIRGEWFLWILNAYWKLSIPNFGEVTGASSYKRKSMALARLDGQKITCVSINPRTSATHLVFDLGAILDIRRKGLNEEGDIWSLYCPDQKVLSVRGDGKYSYEIGSTHPDQVRWIPLTGPE